MTDALFGLIMDPCEVHGFLASLSFVKCTPFKTLFRGNFKDQLSLWVSEKLGNSTKIFGVSEDERVPNDFFFGKGGIGVCHVCHLCFF